MVLNELLAIPVDATIATIQSIEMEIISTEQAEVLLNGDAIDEKIHECILKNGRFLFDTIQGGNLSASFDALFYAYKYTEESVNKIMTDSEYYGVYYL